MDARADAPVSCDAATPSPVTFRMKKPDNTDYCVNLCNGMWITILPMGSNVPLSVTRGCTTTCAQCQPIACGAGACIPPQHVKPEGETFMWDGTLWETSKCGPMNFACVDQVCSVPAGKYVARMCAYHATGDGGSGTICMFDPTPVCTDVPFDYPTSAPVEGTLQ
jgi:hypothetical protein